MKLIRFTGRTATKKIVNKADFLKHGIEDQGRVEFDVVDIPTLGQAWVSDDAAKFLIGIDKFEEVPEDQRATALRINPDDLPKAKG